VTTVVRVRPPLNPTDPGYDLIPQRFRDSTCEVPSNVSLVVQSQQGKKQFVFDRVFEEDTVQKDVWGYVSDSVNSFVQGYNVSILAYGQSGSGKSYTMGTSGPQEQDDPEHMGIIPRAAQTLFEKLNASSARPTSGLRTPKRYSTLSSAVNNQTEGNWTLKATYVEIYNEQLRDLLVPETVPQADRATVAIREDTKGRILLTGLTQYDINSADDIYDALNFGSSIRQTDATAINARSSRSHAVFSLNLVQKRNDIVPATPRREHTRASPSESAIRPETVVTIDSKLHFVDLAGSERLKNTGATGDRAKEGISINAGLASLGKVISQLSSKQGNGHISYRDSRLTRLLQDSLGGNAITFMIACVTPASFHMNETLNTLDYARRARSIQVRPEIQQSHEEGDKQAAIDRLRAEVSFLREQISHSEHGVDRSGSVRARLGERPGKQQIELQNQLMDMQENYTALSRRHAKLISEISKARDDENADTPTLKESLSESAMERLQRSNSFAEAVEQVVLEYEKTIQTLETSLSSTRGSLASTESTLLEKQTRIAYMEQIQQQLQARIQKAADREENNESYLHDLESRMEGSATGEEQSAAVIAELRKELVKARENSTNVEDYVSTLEERLAEAEQDQEIMQRDIDRLEQVIERQRSIGRLDNLLSELDNVRGNGKPNEASTAKEAQPDVNGHQDKHESSRPVSSSEYSQAADDVFTDTPVDTSATTSRQDEGTPLPSAPSHPAALGSPATLLAPRSPAQDDYMADKLENLTQELFDLRSEHESVVTDYDNLQQKYQTALETLAKLEYDKEAPRTPVDSSASRPESFLAQAGVKEELPEEQEAGQPSSSRSLLEELSSRGEVNTGNVDDTTTDADEDLSMQDEIAVQADAVAVSTPQVEKPDVRTLRRVNAEKDATIRELTQNYKNLAEEHHSALLHIEDLKQELYRVSAMRPTSTSPSVARPSSPALPSPGYGKFNPRRKSEDPLGGDRAAKSCASLKNIALDNLESDSVARHNFDLNLNLVMTELHSRSERVQSLEAELTTIKKEMEGKQAIISGLTRERSSLKANSGSVDFSVVGQMRDQLMESEQQIRNLHEQHSAREREFQDQIDSLKSGLEHRRESSTVAAASLPTPTKEHMPGDFPQTPANELSQAEAGASRSVEQQPVAEVERMQAELAAWEAKHSNAMDGMKASEASLLATIAGLQESLRKAEQDMAAPRGLGISNNSQMSDEERSKHKEIVDALQRQTSGQALKLEQLEESYSKILAQVNEESQSKDRTEKDLDIHRDLVANLTNQLHVHQGTITLHQDSLESLQATHSKEIDELKASMAAAEADAKERDIASADRHSSSSDLMQAELTKLQNEHTALLAAAAAALGTSTDSTTLKSQIEGLVDEGKELHTRHTKATNDLKGLQEELQASQLKAADLQGKFDAAKDQFEEAQKKLDMVTTREKKSSRLVEELEEQLNSNFDSHQAATNRLSRMETASVQARQETERELEELRMRNSALEVRILSGSVSLGYDANTHEQQQVAQYSRHSVASDRGSIGYNNRESLSPEAAAIALGRSASQQSAARKSAPPTTALPTPPPSIPLPALPGSDRATSPIPGGASPPASRHASKDGAGASAGMTQLIEDQEARIRTIEKHLFAEKQLTATLEEALVDLETSANRTKTDMDGWKRKCQGLEDELVSMRKESNNSRASLQAVEEEREMRVRAERARQALEERMRELNAGKKKKKGALNCF
jgi:chromosome segregation ATPase